MKLIKLIYILILFIIAVVQGVFDVLIEKKNG